MVSEAPSSHLHRREWHGEKQLAPAHLIMPIFKLTDPNMDVTYTLWRFDVQGWLDQYQEESMMPYIYSNLRGYPSWWVCSLDGGQNLTVTEFLELMDHAFGNRHEYDTMIRFLYEIRQKGQESMEEYMLQTHAGADPGGAPGAWTPPLTTKNEAPAPKFYKTEAPECQF